jgi:hypothetical protein
MLGAPTKKITQAAINDSGIAKLIIGYLLITRLSTISAIVILNPIVQNAPDRTNTFFYTSQCTIILCLLIVIDYSFLRRIRYLGLLAKVSISTITILLYSILIFTRSGMVMIGLPASFLLLYSNPACVSNYDYPAARQLCIAKVSITGVGDFGTHCYAYIVKHCLKQGDARISIDEASNIIVTSYGTPWPGHYGYIGASINIPPNGYFIEHCVQEPEY